MVIPNNLLKEWKKLKSYGDAARIAEIANVHHMSVYRAMNGETCTEHLFMVIGNYYKKKKERMDAIVKKFQNN